MGQSGKLSALKVQRASAPGRYGDGGTLWLRVLPGGRKTWECRFTMAGRSRCMGLGALQDVTLAEARELARDARKLVKDGIDPIEARRHARAEAMRGTGVRFREAAKLYIEAHRAGWNNVKHVAQWKSTLDAYVMPVLGDRGVAAIDTGDVTRVLEPIWREKPETASRVRGRIEAVLNYAKSRGWRAGENPAQWKGHLANLLPARSKIARVEHHAALPWSEIGAFMAELRAKDSISARALEFAILTAARSGEIRGCHWEEIDLTAGLWTVPAVRMKASKEHRVPLSEPALAVLGQMQPLRNDRQSHVFPGERVGRPLNATAFLRVLQRMSWGKITVHGFRSTFRDWAAEATNYPRELDEAALAHALESKVEAAYQRGDLLEKRRMLMADWAKACAATASHEAPARPD